MDTNKTEGLKPVDEIARLLAMGLLRLKLRQKARKKGNRAPKVLDFRADGSIHGPEGNDHE